MQRVSAQELAKKKPSASCCDCGKAATEAVSEIWTIQGGTPGAPHARAMRVFTDSDVVTAP